MDTNDSTTNTSQSLQHQPRRRSVVVIDDTDLPNALITPTPLNPSVSTPNIPNHKIDVEVQLNDSNLLNETVLPPPIDVIDIDTLQHELTRLNTILLTLSENWCIRVESLKLLSQLCMSNDILINGEHSIELLYQYKSMCVTQLSDRRSAVIKEACHTIQSISLLCHNKAYHDDRITQLYTELVCYWLIHLYPLVAVTIAVINQSAIQCIETMIKHVSNISCSISCNILHILIEETQHKHSEIRRHAYKSIAIWMNNLHSDTIEYIRTQEAILQELQQCIQRGINDSNANTRTQARTVLIAMTTHYTNESSMIRDQMSPSHQKTFDREFTEYNINHTFTDSNTNTTVQQNETTNHHHHPNKQSITQQMKAMRLSHTNDTHHNEKIPIDIKLPNKPAPTTSITQSTPPNTVQPAATKQSVDQSTHNRNALLLSRLLDLNEPIITDKMLNYLLNEHVTETFLSFLAIDNTSYINWERVHKIIDAQHHTVNKRLSNKSLSGKKQKYNNSTEYQSSQVELYECFGNDYNKLSPDNIRDKINYNELCNDMDSLRVKRSFTVMSLLCTPRPTSNLLKFIQSKFDILLYNVLSVYHVNARSSNVYHASQILSKLLQLYPNQCYTYITHKPGSYFIYLLFHCIAEPPVLEVILTLLAVPIDDTNQKKQLIKLLLHQHNYMHGCIWSHLSSNNIHYVLPATEFLSYILDKTFYNQTLYAMYLYRFHDIIIQSLDMIFSKQSINYDIYQYILSFIIKFVSSSMDQHVRVLNLEQSLDQSTSGGGGEITEMLPTKLIDNPLYVYLCNIQDILYDRYDIFIHELISFNHNKFQLYNLYIFQLLYHCIALNIHRLDGLTTSQQVSLFDHLFNHHTIGLYHIDNNNRSIIHQTGTKKSNAFYTCTSLLSSLSLLPL